MDQEIFDLIGYHFQNKKILEQALTHRSYSKTHNERLEFLGDALLGLIMSDWLYVHHQGTEGDLSLIRSNLVNKKTLAKIAKQLKLSEFIQVGAGASKSNNNLLANVTEAIIGAIYLDSDWSNTKSVVLNWYEKELSQPIDTINQKDFKSQLQESCHKLQRPSPKYTILKTAGDLHEQTFFVSVKVHHLTCSGSGSSKKAAEQNAAKTMLGKLNDQEN